MAVLTAAERQAPWAELMRDLSGRGEAVAVTKSDLRAALDAADDWAEANAASFNAAIPQPARAQLTARQKAMLLAWVITRRWAVQ